MELHHGSGKIDYIQTLDTTVLPPDGGTSGLLTVLGTGGVLLPSGTTGQRPTSTEGLIRYNSTTTKIEFCQGSSPSWYTLDSNSLNIISQLSDFPAPVAGVITLLDNTVYIIKGAVNVGINSIVLGEKSIITGFNNEVDGLIYTGTSTFISAINKNVELTRCYISCTLGTVFSISGSGVETAHLEHINFNGCKSIGSFGNLFEVRSFLCEYEDTLVSGFSLYSNVYHLLFLDNICLNCNGRVLDLDSASISDGIIRGNLFSVPVGQTGIYADTLVVAYQISIVSNTFSGAGTFLSGITQDNSQYEIIANSGVADSQHIGEFYMIANATATTIAASNTYYKISGTTVAGTNSQFTHTTGRLTNNSRLLRNYFVTATASISSGSNNQTVVLSIYKNGSIVTSSEIEVRLTTASESYPITVQSVASLSLNDYIEIYIKNTTAANNVTVEYINLVIR